VRHLLDCGISPSALYREGDGYFGIATDSTALHVAAWRAWPAVVTELIARDTPLDGLDGRGRTALQLAVEACVRSFWTERRSPESVAALLDAGASVVGVAFPSAMQRWTRCCSSTWLRDRTRHRLESCGARIRRSQFRSLVFRMRGEDHGPTAGQKLRPPVCRLARAAIECRQLRRRASAG
jgi:hypothetical protein